MSTLQYGASMVDVQLLTNSAGGTAATHWQSFVAGTTGKLTQLVVYSYTANSGFTLNIYSGHGTSGTLLHTQSASLSSGIVSIYLSAPLNLINGQAYTWEIIHSYSYTLVGDNWSSYWAGTSSSAAAYSSNFDYYFKTYMSTPFDQRSILVDTEGNVGIMESSPARSLHVGDAMRLEPTSAPSSPAY